jgi:PAS domain S-box-containing protein
MALPLGYRFVCRLAALVLCLGCVGGLGAVPVSAGGLQDKRILILTSYGDGRPGVQVLLQGFTAALGPAGLSQNQVFIEHLDLERNPGPGFQRILAATLKAKLSRNPVDLVYVLEQPALDFFLRELAGPTQGVPVILARAILPMGAEATGHRFLRQLISYDVDGTIHRAMDLLPDTRRVLFVVGSTESDRAVLAQAKLVMKPWRGAVTCEDTAGLTLDQVWARIKAPPPGTIIVILPFDLDAEGRTTIQMEMAFRIAATAGAPVFTLWDNPVGRGAMGGSVTNFFDVGQQAGEAAVGLLGAPGSLGAAVTDLPARFFPKFDWFEIERWHGDAARLPRGATFINKPASFWAQYRRTAIIILMFLLGQTALIALLLVERRLRSLTQRRLQESEARFRILVEQAPEAIIVYDPAGAVLIDANANAERLFGVSRDQLRATGLLPYYVAAQPDGRPATATFLEHAEAALGGEEVLFDRAIRNAEGRDLLCEVRLVRLPSGGRPLVRASFLDVTERKAAEESLRRSEEDFRSLAEAMPQIVWTCRKDGWNNYFNQRWVDYTGLTLEESSGHGWNRNLPFHPEDAPRAWEAWQKAVREGGDYGLECRLRRRDGAYRWWLVRGTPLRGPGGDVLKWFGTCTDIDDLKQAEESRRLLQAQLYQVQKIESLGSLAGGMAHDMNNVLGAILALATVHRAEARQDSRLHRDLETIAKACQRGGTMLKGLLSFARQGLAEEREVDLNDLVVETMALLERTTLQKTRLQLDLAEGLLRVKGDPTALNHCLINLCVNAVDAMPEGGTLTLRTRNEGPGLVLLEVADTGTGMRREVLDKALEPFFTTKAQGKGTGLGLSMVYGTVMAHGGTMAIESEPGLGTRVQVRLPACQSRIEDPVPAGTAPAMAPRQALRVLLVDDDELIQHSIPMVLEILGHAATAVSGGEAALALLDGGFEPDVVILDMNMPGMDGLATLAQLRRLRPRVPVLLATGRVDQAVLNLVGGDAGVALLPKPYGLEELDAILRRLA